MTKRVAEDSVSRRGGVQREGLVMGAFWLCMAAYVLTVCWQFGFPADPAQVSLVLGMPAWVVWGVFVPWCASTVFTIGFALGKMTDEDVRGEGARDLSDHQDG